MKIILSIVVVLLFAVHGAAQTNLNNSWQTGQYGYTINFGLNPDSHDTAFSQQVLYLTGKSSICDTNGNLYIKSNGFELFHADGSLIDNGGQLVDDTFYNAWGGPGAAPYQAQASIILPMENNKYYFVQSTCSDSNFVQIYWNQQIRALSDILQYSVIDMNLNAGLGKVTQRRVPMLQQAKLEQGQMMACRHGNGKDWWLMKKSIDSHKVYTFLFTQDSVYSYGVQHLPFNRRAHDGYRFGQMMFNADGSKFVTTGGTDLAKVYTADFDRCYGLLSNFKELTMPCPTWEGGIDSGTHGAVFSPNSRFIYVAHWAHIYQYDTWDSTWYLVHGRDTSYDWFALYSNLQVTVDGKIVIGHFHATSRQLSTIENPDAKGAACNFCRKCIRAQSTTGWMTGPPNVPNYDLGAKTCWPLSQSESGELRAPEWEVYPNPTSSKLYFKNANRQQKELLNMYGQILSSTTKDEMDVGWLPSGMYYVRVAASVKKVVVE